MKIGIEAQRIFRNNKHGMDYVVLQEILQLQQMDHQNEYYVFVKPGPDRCVEDSSRVHVIEINTPSYPLWEQFALPRAAKEVGVDMLHCTSNTAPILCNIPLDADPCTTSSSWNHATSRTSRSIRTWDGSTADWWCHASCISVSALSP